MWQQTNFIPCPHISSVIVGNEQYWAANTGKAIYGFKNDSQQPLWQCPTARYFSSYDSAVCIGDTAVFPHYPHGKGRTILLGINLTDGNILWELEKVHPAYSCGLLTDGAQLIYSDRLADGERYLIYADPLTGQTRHAVPVGDFNIRAASLSQIGPQYSAIAGNSLYFRDRSDYKLYKTELSTQANALQHLAEFESRPLMLGSDGASIFVPVSEGKDANKVPMRALLRLDPVSGKVLQRVPFPYIRKLNRMNVVSQPPHKGLVALHLVAGNKGQGLMLLDFEQERVRWHVGQEDEWYVSHSVYTPHGIVASIYKAKDRRDFVLFLDAETGEQRYFPELEKTRNNVRWNGRHLIIDSTRGWYILEWAAGAEPATPEPAPATEPTDESTPAERARADLLVHVDPDSPQTEADKLLSQTVRAFLDTMTAQQDKPRFNKNLRRFQSLAGKLFETYPDIGPETIVAGLVQMGVPLAVAQQDVLVLLSRKGGE